MTTDASANLDIYQHDSATTLRFVLRGELAGGGVERLENWWMTATSTLGTRDLVVDLSAVTATDAAGHKLLVSMRESGARLTAEQPPESLELLRSLGIPVAVESRNRTGFLRVIERLCQRR